MIMRFSTLVERAYAKRPKCKLVGPRTRFARTPEVAFTGATASDPRLTFATGFPDFVESVKRAALAGNDVFGGLAPDGGLELGVVLHGVIADRALEVVDAGVTASAVHPSTSGQS